MPSPCLESIHLDRNITLSPKQISAVSYLISDYKSDYFIRARFSNGEDRVFVDPNIVSSFSSLLSLMENSVKTISIDPDEINFRFLSASVQSTPGDLI